MVAIFRRRPRPRPIRVDTNSIIARAKNLIEIRNSEITELDLIHDYLKGRQKHPTTPLGAPTEVANLAKMSRVNIMPIVVSSVAQTMYVEGYRADRENENAGAWEVWQKNKMDARQTGVHRAALTYGTSYVSVVPGGIQGQATAVLKGWSPRYMTTIYADDDDWPAYALASIPAGDRWIYRLYDENNIYFLEGPDNGEPQLVGSREHNIGRVPIVRFVNVHDLDFDNDGEVAPLFSLQDQVDLTTFSLLVAQHYGAFRQRYAIGWTAPNEAAAFAASAARLWTFEDSPDDVKIGEFDQTELQGYLDSREASLRHAATLSQTPVHELIGSLVNLSAEALVAAEGGQRRKVSERQISFGESWEQVLDLAAVVSGQELPDTAQVRWRDTEARAFSATVDALGKIATMLGVPVTELWERIPGATQQDVERWKKAFEETNALGNLTSLLDRQSQTEDDDEEEVT